MQKSAWKCEKKGEPYGEPAFLAPARNPVFALTLFLFPRRESRHACPVCRFRLLGRPFSRLDFKPAPFGRVLKMVESGMILLARFIYSATPINCCFSNL